MDTKQVILIRTDLRSTTGQKIRTGKLIAQAAHASTLALLSKAVYSTTELVIPLNDPYTQQPNVICDWLTGLYTKICLAVNTEQELIELIEKANYNQLPHSLVTDVGLTEFGGIPTITAGAIGPANSDDIDRITSHLSLF